MLHKNVTYIFFFNDLNAVTLLWGCPETWFFIKIKKIITFFNQIRMIKTKKTQRDSVTWPYMNTHTLGSCNNVCTLTWDYVNNNKHVIIYSTHIKICSNSNLLPILYVISLWRHPKNNTFVLFFGFTFRWDDKKLNMLFYDYILMSKHHMILIRVCTKELYLNIKY